MTKINPDDWENEQIAPHRSQTDKHGKYKDPGRCPVCAAQLEKAAEGDGYEDLCHECRAVPAPELLCQSCGTRRVWRSALGVACNGCGNVYEAADAAGSPDQ